MASSDQFLIDNAAQYLKLVGQYKPPVPKAQPTPSAAKGRKPGTDVNFESHPDVVIATRIRPMLEDETASGLVPGVHIRKGTAATVDLHELRKTVRLGPGLNSFNYKVDKAFGPDSSTGAIYSSLVQPLVPWAWSGGISTLFAYGQTGSGKTFTVSGLERLLAEDLFPAERAAAPEAEAEGEASSARNIFVSIIELTGNTAADLLNARKPVSILEDAFGVTHLAGASEYHVTSTAALRTHVDAAASLRRTASTLKNDASSRSHAICRLRLENPALASSPDDGLFYLVDLAGSEAARDVGAHGVERMREARAINASLAVLKDCIRGRAAADAVDGPGAGQGKGQKAYVPFRQSALTKVLKHVFDPAAERSCKTAVVACVNPSFADVGASKNTLRYAEMLRVLVPKAEAGKYDPARPSTWPNEQLREWIGKNSGTPSISPDHLAPTESGRQLLRLPGPELITRCLKTPGVTPEHATAFHSKFWRMHVDSRRGPTSTSTSTPAPSSADADADDPEKWGTSSRDPRPEMAGVPFTQRIRPGMVIQWRPDDDTPGWMRAPGRNLALVMAIAGTAGEQQQEAEKEEDTQQHRGERWTCAGVLPGLFPGAYDVRLWAQFVVTVEKMEGEVLLEYDAATRYYYEVV